MRVIRVLRAFLPLLASLHMLTACNDEVDSPTHDAITAATPGVSSAMLSSKHKGWGDADCAKCHTEFHSGLLADAQCGFCHGGNGAPGRPAGHSDEDCQTCHAQSHSGLGFSAPAACRFCHGYEPVADNECAFEESYDVVVIGAGGGGLSAATTLIDEGLSVALLEQGVQVGGSMVRFRRGDYDFEASLHAFDGMGLSNLEKLGIDEAVKPLVGEVMYRAIYPDFTLDVPSDVTAYRTLLKKHFPDDAAGIDALMDNFSSFNFGVYADMSVAQAIESHGIDDPKFLAVFTELAGFLGGGPHNLPAQSFMGMWASYHLSGYYYFEGGSAAISNALADRFANAGGILKLGTKATGIDIEAGKATRVRTASGGCLEARYVVSNASIPTTYLDLVGKEHLPAEVVEEVEAKKLAPSTTIVYLGVDFDYSDLFPSGSHEIILEPSYGRTKEDFDAMACTPEKQSFAITNYSAIDSTGAPAGKNAIALTINLTYDCFDDWGWTRSYGEFNEQKADIAWQFIERAEEVLPELSTHIEVLEVATPQTIEQYTQNPKGSWAGFDVDPSQGIMAFSDPEAHKTPISNLFLTGAWASDGGESVVLGSGLIAAALVLVTEP